MNKAIDFHPRHLTFFVGLALLNASTSASEAHEGLDAREIYHEYCSVCHGDNGDGRSHAQNSFDPPPRNFTAPEAAAQLDRERMLFSVTYGRPDTAMPGWGTRLSKDEIASVVDFVRSTFMKIDASRQSADAEAKGVDRFATGYMDQAMPYGLHGDKASGQAYFRMNCVVCHGVNGDGKGPRAYFILPKPRDYRHPAARAKLNRPALFEAIAKGSNGTEMPAWEKVLDKQEIANIAEYVFDTFIKPEPTEAAKR